MSLNFRDFVTKQTPLIYPTSTTRNTNQYTNVILIDSEITDYNTIVQSTNNSTFPIVYSINSTKTELLSVLKNNFNTISRISICFKSILDKPKTFLDSKPLFRNKEIEPYCENVAFIINVIKEFNVKNIDFFACNTLKFSNWVDYYNLLTKDTGVIVGASNDKTGNIKNGGDWVMETTNQDIESIYFNQNIGYFRYVLDNPIILKIYKVDYGPDVHILLTIDYNNYYDVYDLPNIYTGPPTWLYDFTVYYNGSYHYTLADLNGLVLSGDQGISFPFNDNLTEVTMGFWATSNYNIQSPGPSLLSIIDVGINDIRFTNVSIVNTICFKENTQILTNNGYIPIQNLRKGDLVKTLNDDYKPIDDIRNTHFYHPSLQERIKDQLYKYTQKEYPEVFEDLIVTGTHSILVDNIEVGHTEKIKKVLGKQYKIDNKYCLPSCVNDKSSIYEHPGSYNIYHFALESDSDNKNYGIYANGLLTESCSKKCLKFL